VAIGTARERLVWVRPTMVGTGLHRPAHNRQGSHRSVT
jgi:hypothetical protein